MMYYLAEGNNINSKNIEVANNLNIITKTNRETIHFLHVAGNELIGFGIYEGDTVMLNLNIKPKIGDFTLMSHSSGNRIIRLLGRDFLENYIICSEFITYPYAKILNRKIKLLGVVMHLQRNNKIVKLF